MFLGRSLGKRLEPVSDMGDMVFQSPDLHALSDFVSGRPVKMFPVVDAVQQRSESVLVKIGRHLAAVEHQFPEILRREISGLGSRDRFLLEGLLH